MFNTNNSEYKEIKFKGKHKTNLSILVVLILATLLGLFVFFISNLIFLKKTNKQTQTTTETKTEISIKDESIINLYNGVIYSRNDKNNHLFIKNKQVTNKSITNLDKYTYALQFVQKTDIKEETINNEKIYTLSSIKIKEYIEQFWGENIKYVSHSIIPVTFAFLIDDKNTGTILYDEKLDTYKINLTEKKEEDNDTILKPYNRKLSKAYKEKDAIHIVEDIFYIEYEKTIENIYNYKIYADYEHTILLDTKENIKENDLKKNGIKIDDNIKATTITYTFKTDNKKDYYFYKSKIDY